MKLKKTPLSLIFLLLLIVQTTVGYAQYTEPLNIPPALSAGFGELRNNHFHSGIDFKTQLAVNKPVFAVADGYISRISVSPGGYTRSHRDDFQASNKYFQDFRTP